MSVKCPNVLDIDIAMNLAACEGAWLNIENALWVNVYQLLETLPGLSKEYRRALRPLGTNYCQKAVIKDIGHTEIIAISKPALI